MPIVSDKRLDGSGEHAVIYRSPNEHKDDIVARAYQDEIAIEIPLHVKRKELADFIDDKKRRIKFDDKAVHNRVTSERLKRRKIYIRLNPSPHKD